MSDIQFGAVKGVIEAIRYSRASELLILSEEDKEVLKSVRSYLNKYGGIFDLDKALSEAVVNDAKSAIGLLKKGIEKYADHACAEPEYLAYALQNNRLSWSERRTMRKCLDHEKTLEEFCKHYSSINVIENLRVKLFAV